ncbi:MAG: S8 family serine peptidase [Bacteroidia bacterium]
MKYFTLSSGLLILSFLVSCEVEFPIEIDSDKALTINELSDEAIETPVVRTRSANFIEGEYIVTFQANLPYFERMDAELSMERSSGQRMSQARITEIRAERETIIRTYLENTLEDYQLDKGAILQHYDGALTKGGLIKMDKKEAETLAKDPRIDVIEPNEVMVLDLNLGAKGRLVPADDGEGKQMSTYNINAIGGSRNLSNHSNWAFIVDSGIDLNHPDLVVKGAHSMSFVPSESSADDKLGHGTHVAGIIGAKDNNMGALGVAAGVPMVAFKVVDRNGYGTKDYLLQAISQLYYIASPGDVVNLSLGTSKSNIINNAIEAAQSKLSIYFTIAAGNQAVNADRYSPSDMHGGSIFVTGALNPNETLTSFSNYGNSVNYLAPGKDIYSTFKDGQYAWLSGTSMAAPHVAGILLAGNGSFRVKKYVRFSTGNSGRVVKHKN